MRRVAMLPACLLLIALQEMPTAAWGFDAHRFITEQAIALLPSEMRPFYQDARGFIVEHSVDPDLWRNVGWDTEDPHHFLDLDAYGAPPFEALPRDLELAVAKFGRATIDKNGTLPWRVGEMYNRLVKSFTEQRDGTSPWALENIKLLSAVVSHYISDAHVPLHAILNHDGQLTNQHGLHSRFEMELFLRYRDQLRLDGRRLTPVRTPVDFTFDTLLASFKESDGILKADLEAIESGDTYDERYFGRFFARVQPTLEQQLGRAVVGVVAALTGAWESAGKPVLPVNPPRAVRKKKAPGTP